jgi:hypothetical protein
MILSIRKILWELFAKSAFNAIIAMLLSRTVAPEALLFFLRMAGPAGAIPLGMEGKRDDAFKPDYREGLHEKTILVVLMIWRLKTRVVAETSAEFVSDVTPARINLSACLRSAETRDALYSRLSGSKKDAVGTA